MSSERVTFKHGQKHDDHVLLEAEEILQEINLRGMFAKFILHISKQEEETSYSVPQSGVC